MSSEAKTWLQASPYQEVCLYFLHNLVPGGLPSDASEVSSIQYPRFAPIQLLFLFLFCISNGSQQRPTDYIAELTELFQRVSYSLPTYTSFSKQNTLGFAGGSVIKNLLAMQVM